MRGAQLWGWLLGWQEWVAEGGQVRPRVPQGPEGQEWKERGALGREKEGHVWAVLC